MPKKGQSPERYPVDATYLTALAKRLEYLSKRYGQLAAALENRGEIRITGKGNAERGEGYLKTWLQTLQAGIDDLAMDVGEQTVAAAKIMRDGKPLPPHEVTPPTRRRKKAP